MNTYKFNWNVVVHECPEYKQYVQPLVVPNEGPAWDPHNHRPYVDKEDTEEEKDVLSEMCDNTADENLSRRSQLRNLLDQMVEQNTEEEDKVIEYTLKKEYKNPPLAENYNPLQLLPPKRFLDIGSELLYTGEPGIGYSVEYLIVSNQYRDPTRDLIKMKLSIDGDKIRLIHARYWFDQYRNITGDRRGSFRCLVYNTKTHNIHFMRRQDHKNVQTGSVRYTNKVRGMLWSIQGIHLALDCFSERSIHNFLILVERAVRKDIPDVFIPDNRMSYRAQSRMFTWSDSSQGYNVVKLIALIVQHKAGCRLDWMQPEFIRNMAGLIYISEFERTILGSRFSGHEEPWEIHQKRMMNRLSYRVSKVMPTIRKYRSPKKLIKTLCGKYYYSLLLKLAFLRVKLDERDWVTLMQLHHKDKFPKIVYHWLIELLKDPEKNISFIAHVLNVIHRFNDKWLETELIDSWVSLNKRSLANGSKPINWDIWKDTCRMANELHIRLRPNKFVNAEQVEKVHDKLAAIQRRDLKEKIKYENIVFEEFDAPDKEYDGFKFVQLKTTNELVHEGTTMHHCVGGYSGQCANGYSIIFSMRKDERSYVTIELHGGTYAINQKYTIHDNLVTSAKALDIIKEWHEDVLEMHEYDGVTYYDMHVERKKVEKEERLKQIEEEFCRAAMDDTVNESPVDEEGVDDFIEMLEEAAHGEA